MNHNGIENAITPNQATPNNDVIAHLPMTSNLFSFDCAEEECPRILIPPKPAIFATPTFFFRVHQPGSSLSIRPLNINASILLDMGWRNVPFPKDVQRRPQTLSYNPP
ncbi:hypothetical protein TNCV_3475641 [Trichonephila clavipes]|nr:hypothetical protein TNCV_3475641 [Trichonephila clavipes]